MKGRDMYSDLEKIEARGKRKKERKKGFSLFGKRENKESDEPVTPVYAEGPTVAPEQMEEPNPPPDSGEPAEEPFEDLESMKLEKTQGSGPEPEVEFMHEPMAPEPEPAPEEEKTVIQIDTPESPPPPEPVVENTPAEPVPETQEEIQTPPTARVPDEEKGPALENSRSYQRDIYAEMDKIETRGKSLKEKRSWGFGSGKPKKAEPERQPKPVEEPTQKPAPAPGPEPLQETEWQPLTDRKLKKAEEAMVDFKRKLDKAFKSGQLSRDQCITNVKEKEMELGLKPPI